MDLKKYYSDWYVRKRSELRKGRIVGIARKFFQEFKHGITVFGIYDLEVQMKKAEIKKIFGMQRK